MSKRAETAALKAYTDEWMKPPLDGMVRVRTHERNIFIKGYEQAEKDTIERACEYLFKHYAVNLDEFRKAMEEE